MGEEVRNTTRFLNYNYIYIAQLLAKMEDTR